MPSWVEIQYDPYLPRVSILIDGRPVPGFSRLIQYSDEDIWQWINDIHDAIYAEIRDEYGISFVGNDFDADILRKKCENERYCIGFRKKEFIVADSVQHRLVALNQLIRKSGLTSYEKTVIDAFFCISPAMQKMMDDINEIDINNLFSAVRVQMIGSKFCYEENDKNILFIVAENMDQGQQCLAKFDVKWPAYVIIMGSSLSILNVTRKGIFIETRSEELFSVLFQCFLHRPLVVAMRNCINSIHSGGKIAAELLKIRSTEPVVHISVDSDVEVGRSVKISATFEPDTCERPKLIFKVRNQEIASSDGLNLYGLKEGISILEVYKQGSSQPVFEKKIRVFRRNRITDLVFSDDNLLIGLGDSRTIRMDYYPDDADNSHEIRWRSSDDSVIAVDQKGRISAKGIGSCRIICTAENVSAQCLCEVMPYMKEILVETPDDDRICMTPMQELAVSYRTIPEKCIDQKVVMLSSDVNVVNVVNGVLYAKNAGTVLVTIKNESGRVQRVLNIVVEQQKGIKAKAGFFKNLFKK